jgi:CubicO group peptidase (beta-lactamase class C family)
MLKIYLTLAVLLTGLVLKAQTEQTDRIARIQAAMPVLHNMYEKYAVQNNFPALAYGLIIDGKLMFSGGIGMSNLDKSAKATPQSMFRIASMTKSVTAMGILALRKEGKLKLDDPASLYVPELATMPLPTPDAPPITIRHLLTHMAGFPEDNPWGDRQLDTNDDDLLKLIQKGISFSNAPGVAYEYSNLGYAILGRTITNVSGKPYQQYINENIFKPLGMNNTVWEYTQVKKELLASGYRYEDAVWKEEQMEHDGTYGAMGGLITSIEDFSKYVEFHLSVWPSGGTATSGPVSSADVREMQHPWNFNNLNAHFRYPGGRECAITSAYGYGLRWSRDCEGRVGVGHTGGLPGFGSQWQILPDYGVGIIAFANRTYAGMSTINTNVLDTLINLAKLSRKALPVSEILKERQAQLLKILPQWKSAEQSGIFAENFFPDKSVAHRLKESQNVFEKAGKIESVSGFFAENRLRGYFIMNGTRQKVKVYFTLTPEHEALIQQLDVSLMP